MKEYVCACERVCACVRACLCARACVCDIIDNATDIISINLKRAVACWGGGHDPL